MTGLVFGGCSSGESSAPSRDAGAAAEEAPSGHDLAGEVGPNGRVALSGVELQSTPRSLYRTQTQGGTAISPVAGLSVGLTVLREDGQLCVELHGLPIGGNLLGASCDIPAYEFHDEVEEIGWAYVSDVVIDGEPARVVWGMTYLDATMVDLGPGGRTQVPESHFPYWMHRFFALAAPADATAVRLLDEAGDELVTLPLEHRA